MLRKECRKWAIRVARCLSYLDDGQDDFDHHDDHDDHGDHDDHDDEDGQGAQVFFTDDDASKLS